MLRTSSYTIFVDLPEERDEVLLIHGYTGAYDKVSRPVARYLRSLSGRQAQDGRSADAGNGWQPRGETFEVLQRRGYLTARTHEEEEGLFGKVADALLQRNAHARPGYVILPTYSCNLRCPYCFQRHMRTDPALGHLIRTMAPEMVDRIFAALPAIEERHGVKADDKRPRSLLLFGGEPLLAASRPIVEHILEKARELGEFKFSAISNATELDAYRDLLGPGKIESVQVTVDGVPAEHDLKRAYADGSGSFAKIAANVGMALELGVRINLRLNIDSKNVAHLPQIAEEIAARGWKSYPNFGAYVSPVHATGDQAGRGAGMDTWRLKKALLAFERDRFDLHGIGNMDENLRGRLRRIFERRQDPAPGFRTTFCAAHSTMYIFDAFGDVYACWEHLGDPRIRVGHIAPEGEISLEQGQLQVWRSRNVTSNPVCRRCRYAFYCGGGCANLAWVRTGDLHTSHCDGFAHRFQVTAAQVYLDFLGGRQAEVNEEPACDQ